MATTVNTSRRELKRVANDSYEGRTLKVMLCQVGSSGFTAESSVSDWQSVEISGNGYVRYTTSISTGAYNETTASYNIPPIDAVFTAAGSGYSFDRIIPYVEGTTYIHSEIVESPNVTLAAGQTETYRIALTVDD
jgi:hypothetical protein